MRIAIDTDSRRVLTWQGVAVEELSFSRLARFPVEVKMLRGPSVISLPDGAAARLALKTLGAYAGVFVALAGAWIKSGTAASTVYTFDLDLNTAAIEALFSSNTTTLDLVMEIEWTYSYNGLPVRQTSLPVPVSLGNSYIRTTEGTPGSMPDFKATQQEAVDGLDNTKWMTPLRVKQAVSAARAGGLLVFMNPNGGYYTVDSLGNQAPLDAAPLDHQHIIDDVTNLQSVLDSKPATVYSDAPPASPVGGQRWVSTIDFRAYEYINGAWIETIKT